jgi:phosphoglycolate phosphatase-like HAD superfamily hydrolase
VKRDISYYKTIVFDCDGVILNSNRIKTQAFYNAALPYGVHAAQKLVEYHVLNGGISRYKKFELFINNMVSKSTVGPSLDDLLSTYAIEVRKGLLSCEVAKGLPAFREMERDTKWMIVSGGDQAELREVLKARAVHELFDSGIFGSPDSKEHILGRELARGNIVNPALFLGDSRYDHIAAAETGLDFVFLSSWSEFKDWRHYCAKHQIPSFGCLSDLGTYGK